MGIQDLMPQKPGTKISNNNNPKKVAKINDKKKETQHTFSIRHDVSTKVLLDRLQKVKTLTTPTKKTITRGTIIREALELLAKNMDYSKKEKKYFEFLEHINSKTVLKN